MQADPQRANGRGDRPVLLLLEPYFVMRHTVAAVARELGLADIVEATSLDGARQQLARRPFDACMLSVAPDRRELELIQQLRSGALAAAAHTPVAVTTAQCDGGMILTLKELQVSRIVLTPFKVKVLLETLTRLVADGRACAPPSGPA